MKGKIISIKYLTPYTTDEIVIEVSFDKKRFRGTLISNESRGW